MEASSNLTIDEETIFHSAFKSLIGAIPGFGGFLSEIYTYRSQVKQKRLNRFVEIATQLLSEAGGISAEEVTQLTSEDFGDLFESVIRRVLRSRSEAKSRRFAKILIGSLQVPVNLDYSETFLDLISGLSEKQIEILAEHEKIGDHYVVMQEKQKLDKIILSLDQQLIKERSNHAQGLANNLSAVDKELKQTKEKAELNLVTRKTAQEIQSSDHYDLSQSE